VNVLLSGIVGSTAYGLDHEGSDVDRLGVFAAPTAEFHGLCGPRESVVRRSPDETLHEAAKWCRLALGGNPTVLELVWLPGELYEVRTEHGDGLIAIRDSFLCAPRVRDAYLGYATQQFTRLRNRMEEGNASFSPDTRKRTAKHARHLMRLCYQGYDLYSTGQLHIRVDNPEKYMEFGNLVAEFPEKGIEEARKLLARIGGCFDSVSSPLPQSADHTSAEAWLLRVRNDFYKGGSAHAD
jgi:hypothetical protein